MTYTYSSDGPSLPAPGTAARAAGPGRRLRVLLTEGSGLTARQTATRLARAGHEVEVLSAAPFCLARLTRHVRRVHPVARLGAEPLAWLDDALGVWDTGRFDVLLPTHEQVAALAARPDRLAAHGVATAVPPFEALVRVLDKVAATGTLRRLGLPQPDTEVVTDPAALDRWDRFPVVVKAPVGTASGAVAVAADRAGLRRAEAVMAAAGAWGDGGLLLQEPVPGPLVMVQGVFDHGRLVAWHGAERTREGTRGGASAKASLADPDLVEQMAHLGRALGWHGACAADVILGPDGPAWIDVNPRLVEPNSAWAAGTDLVGPLVELARGGHPSPQPVAPGGVRTRQALLGVLGAAATGRRRTVAGEVLALVARRGPYHHSTEELTPAAGDWRGAAVPAVVAALALVVPGAAAALAGGAVDAYALTSPAWRQLRLAAVPSLEDELVAHVGGGEAEALVEAVGVGPGPVGGELDPVAAG